MVRRKKKELFHRLFPVARVRHGLDCVVFLFQKEWAMKMQQRMWRWMVVVCSAGLLPVVVMRCDKAALNFQRGLFHGLGQEVSTYLVDQVIP